MREIQWKAPLQEKGFEPLASLMSETRDITKSLAREKLCTTPKEPTCIPIVQEFYAALKEADMNRKWDMPWRRKIVRGKEVSISPL